MPLDEDANKDLLPAFRSTRSGAKHHSTAPNAGTPSGSSSHWSLQATGTICQWRREQTRQTTRNPAQWSDWGASDLQEQGILGAHLAREPSATTTINTHNTTETNLRTRLHNP
jgi:hypothetical protein